MTIKSSGIVGQHKLTSNVVNVPVEISTQIEILPRNLDANNLILVKYKRSKSRNENYIAEQICPQNVYNAIQVLLNSELYIKHNIQLSKTWHDEHIDKDYTYLQYTLDEQNKIILFEKLN
jgi:hypothetical protein